MVFRGSDENASSFYRGYYVELIYAFAENDESLARHLDPSTWFSIKSNREQNNPIELVAEVVRTDIRNDVNDAGKYIILADLPVVDRVKCKD